VLPASNNSKGDDMRSEEEIKLCDRIIKEGRKYIYIDCPCGVIIKARKDANGVLCVDCFRFHWLKAIWEAIE